MNGRDASGRFAPGFSPDRGCGRHAATPLVALHEALRHSVLSVANAPTVVRSARGRRRTVSLFEALLLRLGTGRTSRRSSPTAFLHLVVECAAAEAGWEQLPPTADPTLLDAKARLHAVLLAGTTGAVDDAIGAYMTALRRAR